MGLHTLCLLDIKVKEPTVESLARGKPVYMDPRYMRTHQAADQLLEASKAQKVDNEKDRAINENTPCIGLARVGTDTQVIRAGTLKEFMDMDLGEPMHSFIVCGEMHEMEQ